MLQHDHLLGFGIRSVADNEPVQYLLGEGKRDKPAAVMHLILQGCDAQQSKKLPMGTVRKNWKMVLVLPQTDNMKGVAGVIIYTSH